MAEQKEQTTKKKLLEAQLVGQRVSIRSFDWKQQLTGELIGLERFTYILRLDGGNIIGVLKHSAGAIGAVGKEE